MSLVGRQAALQEIDRMLAALPGSQSVVLSLSGEPGVGKTRLLTEIAERADARGYLVLDGRAAEFERDTPFAIVVAALDDYLASAGPDLLVQLSPAAVAHLANVFPAVTPPADVPRDVLQAERYRIHRAVRSLVDALAVASPLVLILDDIHWMDSASAELLAHLVTYPPAHPVLIATTHRSAQLPSMLQSALDRGVSEGRVRPIDVRTLSRADTAELVPGVTDAGVLDALYADSGGNPFYLLELLRGERRSAVVDSPDGDVPAAVLAAIDREIATLPDAARLLAYGGAVAGEPFLLDAAATAADFRIDTALPAIDQLLGSGLVTGTDVPRRFRFRHPIVRRAVYESAGPGWRLGAHRRLADSLRERGASPVELAHHVGAAAEPGDAAAVDVLTAAGHALMSRAPAIAAGRFEAAVRLLSHEDPRRVELLVPLAVALGGAGRLHECRARLDEALSLLPSAAAGPRAGLTAFCASIEHLIGKHASAHSRLATALAAIPDRTSVEAGTLMLELAADALWRSDWANMRSWAREACAVGQTVRSRTVQAQGLALLAWASFGVGEIPAAIDSFDRAESMVDDMPDTELAHDFGATFYLARASFMLERYESAVRHADRGLALGRAAGRSELFLSLLTAKSAGLRMLGRLREADEADQGAVESARLVGHDQVLALALLDRIASWTAMGDIERAVEAGGEAHDLSARLGRSPASVVIGFVFGEALLAAGQPDRCVAIAQGGLGDPEGSSFAVGGRGNAWHLLARAEAERGRLTEAREWIDRLDAIVASLEPLALPLFQVDFARATVLLAAGDAAASARAAVAAADTADRIHARIEAGRARVLAGRALGVSGDRDAAVAVLEQARAELAECGAHRYHDQAVQDLRKLGKRIGRGGRRATGDAGLDRLSERELEITEMVAKGRTNKEIGDALFISTRTVERHLSHVFDKLGVSSRTELGSTIERARASALEPVRRIVRDRPRGG